MSEVWVDIKGFENLYKISDKGRIINCKNNKILSVSFNNTGGYARIGLRKDGKRKYFAVHRLLAEAFIPNKDNKPCIDHINTIRNDNRIENLRWVTYSENMKNPLTIKKFQKNLSEEQKAKISRSLKGKPHSDIHNERVSQSLSKRPVLCVETGFIFRSVNFAAKELGLWRQNITKAIQGKTKKCGGYHWQYV